MDDNMEIIGDIDAFFLSYESGAMATAYDKAILRQKENFKLSMDLQDRAWAVAVFIDASED